MESVSVLSFVSMCGLFFVEFVCEVCVLSGVCLCNVYA